MVVECGNMAASNTLSTVNGHTVQQRRGRPNVFQCQQVEQDLVRLHSGSSCDSNKHHPQSRADFLNAKDASRRKRVNRSAKLKQCKLDARREQWLSQGSQGKQGKGEQQQHQHSLQQQQHQHRSCEHHHKAGDTECMAQERAGPSGHSRNQGSGSSATTSERTPVGSPAMHSRSQASGSSTETRHPKKEALVRRQDPSTRAPKYFGDEEPHGGGEHKPDVANNGWSSSDVSKSRSNSSCASSSYTESGSEEDNDESHDAEDDWEAAFDALHVQSSPHRSEGGSHKGPSSDRALHGDGKELHAQKHNGAHHHPDSQSAQLKPEYKYKSSGFGGRRGNGGRAWRPDDVSRPPTLPRLTKQHTYPSHQGNGGGGHQGWSGVHGGSMWGLPAPAAAPSYCPICTEELDVTDASYMPCSCGFQLCLFCYHRISSDDGRCPGCRKAYNPDLAVKLSRSSSVWLRV